MYGIRLILIKELLYLDHPNIVLRTRKFKAPKVLPLLNDIKVLIRKINGALLENELQSNYRIHVECGYRNVCIYTVSEF